MRDRPQDLGLLSRILVVRFAGSRLLALEPVARFAEREFRRREREIHSPEPEFNAP